MSQFVRYFNTRFYATLHRSSLLKSVESKDVTFFEKVLGAANVLQSSKGEDLTQYNQDWMRIYKGNSQVVLRPNSTEQIAVLLKYCNDNYLPVVPQGGNTGLVGGSIPVFDEIVISLSRMNSILEVNEEIGFVTCESGAILKTVDDHLASYGRIMPLDLGAKGSCQIGGNLSTNAGGVRLLRYGSLRGNTLALQAVLADGRIVDCSLPLRKDNTGLDLKQLFIGSEGTMGIITKASILCPIRPSAISVGMFAVENVDKVIENFKAAHKHLGEILSAFELMDAGCMCCVEENLNLHSPFSQSYPYYILVETSGSSMEHDADKFQKFSEYIMENDLVLDGVIAQDGQQAENLWTIRETIVEAFLHLKEWMFMDVSLPLLSRDVPSLIKSLHEYSSKYGDTHSTAIFGHVGDGNLHLNFTSPKFNPEAKKGIEPFVYEWLKENGGSISAEHGLGQMKAPYLHYSKSITAIELMRSMKQVVDPRGILNPYKFLPSAPTNE